MLREARSRVQLNEAEVSHARPIPCPSSRVCRLGARWPGKRLDNSLRRFCGRDAGPPLPIRVATRSRVAGGFFIQLGVLRPSDHRLPHGLCQVRRFSLPSSPSPTTTTAFGRGSPLGLSGLGWVFRKICGCLSEGIDGLIEGTLHRTAD
jgi:hypothetical protein